MPTKPGRNLGDKALLGTKSAIIFGSFIVTVVLYEVISKIPVVKKIIGVR